MAGRVPAIHDLLALGAVKDKPGHDELGEKALIIGCFLSQTLRMTNSRSNFSNAESRLRLRVDDGILSQQIVVRGWSL
jgi:hypothetical protein